MQLKNKEYRSSLFLVGGTQVKKGKYNYVLLYLYIFLILNVQFNLYNQVLQTRFNE